MIRAILLGVALAASPLPVLGAPPEHADPALAPWFHSLMQPGTGIGCCDLSDCRTVKARIAGSGWEVLIDPKDFPVDEAKWVEVTPDKILRGKTNPTGEPVACYTPALGVLCFVEPAGA